MMIKLLKSRGWKKFKRNRMAMAMLGVIGVYVFITLWIVLTGYINRFTDGSLENRPVLGAFLVSSTQARVAPDKAPGFGGRLSDEKRYLNNVFYLGRAERAADEAMKLPPGGDRTLADVLRESGLPGRPIAADSAEGLRATMDAGNALLTSIKVRSNAAPGYKKVTDLCDLLPALADDVRTADEQGDDDAVEFALDELSITLESIGAELETYAEGIQDLPVRTGAAESLVATDLLAEIDAELLFDEADALFDLDQYTGTLFDEALISRIRDAATNQKAATQTIIEQQIEEIDVIAKQVMPMPTGFGGAIYRAKLLCGTDQQGRSILVRAIYSAKVAIQVGVVTGIGAVLFGSLLGAAAAFFGGWVDHVVNWLYSTFSSIPSLVLLAVLAFMFMGSKVDGTLVPLYVAFGLTFWIGPCRVIRGEALKIKELEYVQAATAIGFGRFYILVRHIIPNTLHLMFINFSLLFIAAIKGEVILTFLGLGLKEGSSWGQMISQSKSQVVTDFFWQIGTATFFMFVLVLAFNILTDALQDAFDPKHVS